MTVPSTKPTADVKLTASPIVGRSQWVEGLRSVLRELESAVERVVLLAPDEATDGRPHGSASIVHEEAANDEVAAISFESAVAAMAKGHTAADGRWLTAAEVEREHIVRTLEIASYNQTVAAKLLDVDRHQLRRRMQEYGLLTPGVARCGRPSSKVAGTRKAA
jgi:DNA-binding NtrC family response regulator